MQASGAIKLRSAISTQRPWGACRQTQRGQSSCAKRSSFMLWNNIRRRPYLGCSRTGVLGCPLSGKPLSQQTFDKMLRNPLYAGWITSAWGISRRGQFEPIVELGLFNLVQDRPTNKGAATRSTRARENPDFLLRVFVRCAECGRGLTGSFSTGRRGKRYPYYCCRVKGCRSVKFSRDKLHHAFHQLLYSLYPEEGFMPLFGEVVKDVWKQKYADHTALAARLEKAFAAFVNLIWPTLML